MRHLPAVAAAAALACAASVSPAYAQPAKAPQMPGVAVYQKTCAACHNGGDETAPELEQLLTLGRDRVSAALKPGGVMAGPAAALSPEQLAQIVNALTVPVERRAAVAIAARNPGGDMPGFNY